ARGREAQLADGRMSLFAGDLDRAMSIFSAAMDRQATKADACRYLAQCYYLKDDLDRAVRTVSIGAAIWPRAAPLMTLFSRIVRNGEDIRRFLDEKVRVARNGFTMGTAAQFVRACGRAGAVEEGEQTARDAVVNQCQKGITRLNGAQCHLETGLKKGAYSRRKGGIVLDHIAQATQSSRLRLFAMGGTLLGLVRDGQLLSWDK